MSLLNAPAESPNKSRAMTLTVVALVFAGALLLWFSFRFYPEKTAVEHFFDALVAGDTARAYQLWKPGENYKMQDFLADWSPNGYYGPVKSFQIVRASTPHGTGPFAMKSVVVEVQISPFSPMPDFADAEKSRKTRQISIWVSSSDKSFSFPP